MIELWLGIAVLLCGALAFLFIPFARARKRAFHQTAVDRKQQNIDIYNERLAELEREFAANTITEQELEVLRLELQRSLLEDTDTDEPLKHRAVLGTPQLLCLAIMALLVPALSLGLYASYGSAALLEVPRTQSAQSQDMPSVEEAIVMLENELAENSENPEGWYILATTYMNLGEFQKGQAAFEHLLEQMPADAPQYAGVMGQYAQSLYFANGKMTDAVRQQVNRTLDIEPLEVTALGLLGIDAFEQKEYADAIAYWRKALQNADAEAASSLKSGIQRAAQEIQQLGQAVPDIPELDIAQVVALVDIDEQQLTQLKPDQPVFVFARAAGQRMPLAAAKLTVADLPARVVLDDSMAMMPQAKLSGYTRVELIARVSLSGEPVASAGDLESPAVLVAVGTTTPVELQINTIVQ